MYGRAPRVSIGMPVYNGEADIHRAIESILAQDYRDLELIICDNASTDATPEICQRYAARDQRVRVYRNETNIGLAPNFNRTVDLAGGEYFKWQSANDWCTPQFLSRCVEVLDQEPDAVLAFPGTVIVDENANFSRIYDEPVDASSPDPVERTLNLFWNLSLCNMVFGVFRTDLLRQTSRQPSYDMGDRVLLLEVALLGRIVQVPEDMFFRRLEAERPKRGSRWLDASNRRQLRFVRPRFYLHYLRAVARSNLNQRQKLTLYRNILSRFLIPAKGRQLIRQSALRLAGRRGSERGA